MNPDFTKLPYGFDEFAAPPSGSQDSGADAPAHDPEGPKNAGVGSPGCDLAPEASVRRPPVDLSPREKARAAAEARRKMAAARRDAKRQ